MILVSYINIQSNILNDSASFCWQQPSDGLYACMSVCVCVCVCVCVYLKDIGI